MDKPLIPAPVLSPEERSSLTAWRPGSPLLSRVVRPAETVGGPGRVSVAAFQSAV